MDRINGARTVDIGGGRRGFRSQNKAAGLDGTEVTAQWLNDIQENLCRTVELHGIALGAGQSDLLDKVVRFPATTTQAGRVELATVAETAARERSDLAVTPAGLFEYQQRLSADLTFFVRADGSDANSGTANTAAGAFRSIQAAVNAIGRKAGSGFSATINVGPGGFPAFQVNGITDIPINVIGAGRSSTLISGSPTGPAVSADNGSRVTVAGCGFDNLTDSGVVASTGATLTLNSVKFWAANRRHIWAEEGGSIRITGAVEIVAGAESFIVAGIGARVTMSSQTIILSNTPAFQQFVYAFSGTVRARSMVFSGTGATGSRYFAVAGGAIDTGGGGANYFPGNAAGTSPSGFYV